MKNKSQFWMLPTSTSAGLALVPSTEETSDALAAANRTVPVRVTMRQPRNGKHHRKYWALLGEVAKNTDLYSNSAALHEAIKLRLGMFDVDTITDTAGNRHRSIITHSIAWDKIDQTEFNRFYERALDVIAADLGFDIEELDKATNH